jgi:cell division protein ZapA (FtsZ GTPase activity inhibitor)
MGYLYNLLFVQHMQITSNGHRRYVEQLAHLYNGAVATLLEQSNQFGMTVACILAAFLHAKESSLNTISQAAIQVLCW